MFSMAQRLHQQHLRQGKPRRYLRGAAGVGGLGGHQVQGACCPAYPQTEPWQGAAAAVQGLPVTAEQRLYLLVAACLGLEQQQQQGRRWDQQRPAPPVELSVPVSLSCVRLSGHLQNPQELLRPALAPLQVPHQTLAYPKRRGGWKCTRNDCHVDLCGHAEQRCARLCNK